MYSGRTNGFGKELLGANVAWLGCKSRLEANLCRSGHRSGLNHYSRYNFCNACWDAYTSHWGSSTRSAPSLLLWTYYAKVGLSALDDQLFLFSDIWSMASPIYLLIYQWESSSARKSMVIVSIVYIPGVTDIWGFYQNLYAYQFEAFLNFFWRTWVYCAVWI